MGAENVEFGACEGDGGMYKLKARSNGKRLFSLQDLERC